MYIQPGTYNTSLIQHFYWWLKQWFSVTGFIAIHRNTQNITNFTQFCLREQNSNIRKTESLWSWHDIDCTRLMTKSDNQRQFVLKQFNEVHLLCLISRMYINKYSFILDVLLKTFYLHNSMWCSNTTYVNAALAMHSENKKSAISPAPNVQNIACPHLARIVTSAQSYFQIGRGQKSWQAENRSLLMSDFAKNLGGGG